MAVSSKIRVGVLRGGPSDEYEVSLKTGATVLKHLSEAYQPIDIFIDRAGRWHTHGVGHEPHQALPKLDVIFNALHGQYGESGEVQHFLETHQFPFSGSGRFACALATNKALAKTMVGRLGIKTPFHKIIHREEANPIDSLAAYLYRSFPQPSVVKPLDRGSSLGTSIVSTPRELADALDHAFLVSDTVLVEEYIVGREATCGVLENYRGEPCYAFLPVEITPPAESRFFDYFAKYSGTSVMVCPGNFTVEEKENLQGLAQRVHQALGLRHYSRSDFIVHPRRGIYFLEADALPDLIEESSPYLKSLHAVGTPIPQFLDHVIGLAMTAQ